MRTNNQRYSAGWTDSRTAIANAVWDDVLVQPGEPGWRECMECRRETPHLGRQCVYREHHPQHPPYKVTPEQNRLLIMQRRMREFGLDPLNPKHVKTFSSYEFNYDTMQMQPKR